MFLSICIKMLAATLLSGAAMMAASYVCSDLTAKVAADMRNALYKKTMSLSGTDFRSFGIASVTTRTVSDITNIQFALGNCFQMLFPVPFIFVLSLVFVFRIDSFLGMILLAVLVVITIVCAFIMHSVSPLFKKLQKKLDGISFFSVNLFIVIVYYLSGARITAGHFEIGDITAIIEYAMLSLFFLMMAQMVILTLPRALECCNRIGEVLDFAPTIADKTDTCVKEESHNRAVLSFQNVSFCFADADEDTLKNLNFDCKRGGTNFSGGQKQRLSIARALVKKPDLYIFDDSFSALDFKTDASLRKALAPETKDATMDEIKAAAKAAKVDYFIRTMPHGYDTVLDNEAGYLSVGQRQLITIARVFLCDPPVIILDEATSSVDTRTEMEISRAMKKLMKGRTSFVIAHWLSTIRDADTILFMEHGNIIEQGNHKELLEKKGAYSARYYSQFA